MEWLNIKTSDLHAPEFIGSDPRQRATWLSVICYCVEQENFGIIKNCRDWKNRRWQQTCGVTLKEVNNCELLLKWENDDLVIWKYPSDKQKLVQDKRITAQLNGQKGGRPKADSQTNIETNVGFIMKPTLEPIFKTGREGKGIGKEEKGTGWMVLVQRIFKLLDRTKPLSRIEHDLFESANVTVQEIEQIEKWFKWAKSQPDYKLPTSFQTLMEKWPHHLDRARHDMNGNGNHKSEPTIRMVSCPWENEKKPQTGA